MNERNFQIKGRIVLQTPSRCQQKEEELKDYITSFVNFY